MIVPEECHLLFKRAVRVNHPSKPPALQFGAIEAFKDVRIGEIETATQQSIKGAVVNGLIVEKIINRAFTSSDA